MKLKLNKGLDPCAERIGSIKPSCPQKAKKVSKTSDFKKKCGE